MFLKESEIRELTGKERPSAQIRELEHLGIPYRQRRDGSGVVTCRDLMLAFGEMPSLTPNARQRRGRKRLAVLPLDQLRGLPIVTNDSPAGIYFLWLGPMLGYIGRSVRVSYRIFQHQKAGKPFTRATWLAAAEEVLDRHEREYIRAYSPPMNISGC